MPQAVRTSPTKLWTTEALLAELGVGVDAEPAADITELKHVKSRVEIRAAEEIANRQPCDDFDRFKPLFKQIRVELDEGDRETRPFGKDAEIRKGDFFILGGQIAYVAEMSEEFVTDYERKDRRLRVIYSNGTENDLLLRSPQRALYKDEAGRRITNPSAGPLFSSKVEDDDTESGTIYVLRSLSDHPDIATERELIHKTASPAASWKPAPPTPGSLRPSCWQRPRWWPPTSSTTLTGRSSKT